ncbi:MAG: sugar kinase [Elusimicrobia bacterium]|nr:sugar kinase [Elusimicrobiota bacterium]MDE2314332.1 sugar kinase [Elusimicrobiota bacterium]
MSSILVVGSVALDSVKTPEGESKNALGGSAVYFSLAARLFAQVSMVGVVGQDFPAAHRQMLSERGVDLSGLKETAGETFRWVGEFDRDLSDAKTLETHLNVFRTFRPALSSAHRKSRAVFLANIDPDIQADVLDQMESPSIVACDTMNYWINSKPEALKKLLGRVHIFFANEEEAKKLTNQVNLFCAARLISEWGPSIVVIKKGEHGVVLKAGRRLLAFPAFPMETLKDPTGAGDSFAGGFMGCLMAGGGAADEDSLKRAALYGTILASFDIEEFSTRRLERVSRKDVEERLADFLGRLGVRTGALLDAA